MRWIREVMPFWPGGSSTDKLRADSGDKASSLSLFVVVGVLTMSAPAQSTEEDGHHAMSGHREAALMRSLMAIQRGDIDQALEVVEDLVRTDPNFRLAQLVRGDLLMTKARGIDRFGAGAGASDAKLRALLDEARARVAHQRQHPTGDVLPASLLQVSPGYRRAFVADVSESRLYLFNNRDGHVSLAGDFYVTSGRGGAFKQLEGDLKTPIGVYFIDGRIPASRLPDRYGAGALPLDYPNEWDRQLGRTGYGIWLHGVSFSTYSRAPRATEGCLALPNEDFRKVWDLAEAKDRRTPVIIVDGVKWLGRDEMAIQRVATEQALERWRQDWESRDPGRYARNYSRDFRTRTLDYHAWLSRKRRVNAAKRFIRVGLTDISVFAYPGEPNLHVVTFDQTYESSKLTSRTRKKQYWKREADGTWRIIYEGEA